MGPYRRKDCFLSPFAHRASKMAHPVSTKVFLKLSPDMAMFFAAFGHTHPPPPVPPFLFMQNLSPKGIAGSDSLESVNAVICAEIRRALAFPMVSMLAWHFHYFALLLHNSRTWKAFC